MRQLMRPPIKLLLKGRGEGFKIKVYLLFIFETLTIRQEGLKILI